MNMGKVVYRDIFQLTPSSLNEGRHQIETTRQLMDLLGYMVVFLFAAQYVVYFP